jgi:hypothetical protein
LFEGWMMCVKNECFQKRPAAYIPSLLLLLLLQIAAAPPYQYKHTTHRLAVALNAMYSSSLAAPAVSGVSAADPPPTKSSTAALGPPVAAAAALTPSIWPTCFVFVFCFGVGCGRPESVCCRKGTTDCFAAALQITSFPYSKTPLPQRRQRAHLDLGRRRRAVLGHVHARQRLRHGDVDALAAPRAFTARDGRHRIARTLLAARKAAGLRQQRRQVLERRWEHRSSICSCIGVDDGAETREQTA